MEELIRPKDIVSLKQKLIALNNLVIGIIFATFGTAIGCLLLELFYSGAKLTPTLIGLSICYFIVWIRYKKQLKSINICNLKK